MVEMPGDDHLARVMMMIYYPKIQSTITKVIRVNCVDYVPNHVMGPFTIS